MTGYALISKRLRENARSGETSFDLIQEMVREALSWRVKNADMRPIVAVAKQPPRLRLGGGGQSR